MSLKSKIEAVIYASEEPVTLAQLVGVLAGEAQAELDAIKAQQSELPLQPDSGAGRTPAGEDSAPGVPEDNTVQEKGSGQNLEAATESGEVSPESSSLAEAPHPGTEAEKDTEAEKRRVREQEKNVREYLRSVVDALIREYAESDRGIEIREVAGGFRMATKPEYHDAVRGFVRSLKPALKLSLQALETLAVVAYKQPVTAAEISEIRGVDSAGVLGGLLTRKLIQTAGRKQVIGRPMLYKTSKEFLVRFGLKDIHELPSMEEFERMAGELNEQEDLPMESAEVVIERANARGDAERIQQHVQADNQSGEAQADETASPVAEAVPSPEAVPGREASETANEQPAEIREGAEG